MMMEYSLVCFIIEKNYIMRPSPPTQTPESILYLFAMIYPMREGFVYENIYALFKIWLSWLKTKS